MGGAVRPFLISQALQQAGYAVEIVGFTPTIDLSFKTNFEIKPLLWQGLASMGPLFKALQGDIIIAYKLKPSSFGLALLHRLVHHRPVILDIDDWELSWHGGENWHYRLSPRQLARDLLKPDGALRQIDYPLYLKWIETLVPLANQITTHSEFLQHRFGGIYLPNGKDTSLFDPNRYDPEVSRRKYGLSDYRILMFPGAPRPYKGVEDILMALDQIDAPDLRLIIVGGSPYDDYDQQLHQRWGKHIIQLPKTSYEQMPELIAAAHILVVPQRDTAAAQAQFPLKLTDGMAMAKPVLATRVGDIPEILGDTGYLSLPGMPAQLANQIHHIFQNYNEALNQGCRARMRCISRYSIQTMSKTLTTLIENLSP